MTARLIAARRSAFCPSGGAFAGLSIEALARPVLQAVLADAGLDGAEVDEIILGNALGAGGNPARRLALAAGLDQVPGLTIDRQCTSGLDAVLLAKAMVDAGLARVVIAGGAESHSQRPHRAYRTPGGPVFFDQARFTPWADQDPDMAVAAQDLAQRLGISRREQDDWAVLSHAKAQNVADWPEIVAINGIGKDPFSRDLTPMIAARAKVVCGSISAANMAVAADGAALCVIVAPDIAKARGFSIQGSVQTGDPTLPGLAPIAAIQRLLRQQSIAVSAFAQIELMEAFAVQAIACARGSGLNLDRLNPKGGALSRGHPIGASGAHLLVRIFHDLYDGKPEDAPGLAAIAGAGGIGSAVMLRR